MTVFDKVIFEVGDKVVRKYKDSKEDYDVKTVVKSVMVENLDNFSYSVLYFENDDSFHIGFEYEPADEEVKKDYYKAWKDVKKQVKDKQAKKVKSKVLKIKI